MLMFTYNSFCFHDAEAPSRFSGDLKKAATQALLLFTLNTNKGDKANSSSRDRHIQSSAGANSLVRDADESLSQTGHAPRFQTQLEHQRWKNQ